MPADANDTDITALLKRSRTDDDARQAVYDLVYDDLRRIAGSRIAASRPGDTLSVTSLVNEAYLKLTHRTGPAWSDRGHFLRVASRAMRQITVDYVREKLAAKRGGGERNLPLDEMQVPAAQKPEMVLALEEGLRELAELQPRLVEIVECRFFAGLSNQETARALGISRSTVDRDWAAAREWLTEYLS